MKTQKTFKLMVLSASMMMLSPFVSASEGATFCYGPECELPPEQWSEEYPDCAGSAQSPIDISGASDASLPEIEFHYTDNAVVSANNGHNTELVMEEGKNHIMVNGQKCDLIQFHFHTLSEHTINGKHSAVEAHLVHACEDTGRNAVVGVLMDQTGGKGNSAFGTALTHAPYDKKTKSYVKGEVEIEGVTVNPSELLPSDTSYYRYDGSLTTPGCGEVADWYVLTNQGNVSKKQVKTFETLLEDTSPDDFHNNNRPLQDLNGRLIETNGDD